MLTVSSLLGRILGYSALFIVFALTGYWLFGGWFSNQAYAALIAVLIFGWIVVVFDFWLAARFLRWLRQGNHQPIRGFAEVWVLASERIRRMVDQHTKAMAVSKQGLADFLEAIQASPSGVILLGLDNRIEWFNATAAFHFGLDVARDTHQHLNYLVRDPALSQYLSNGNFESEVIVSGRSSTPSKPLRIAAHVHPYGGGKSLLLSRDITAIEQAEAMRRDFVANVSHEIRTPLTVLGGFVETLQTLPCTKAEQTHYLALMAQQAQRMQALVDDLLTLSRLEGSALPPLDEWINVDELMQQCQQEAIELSRVQWGKAQSIAFIVEPGWEVSGSYRELHSAVFNLISNAVRYTPDDKNIVIQWASAQLPIEKLNGLSINRGAVINTTALGGGTFTINDGGLGISPEHLSRITERFYRVDSSRSRDTGGTGLGLAIVKHVVQRHQAELRIESTPGTGSMFRIGLPSNRVRRAKEL